MRQAFTTLLLLLQVLPLAAATPRLAGIPAQQVLLGSRNDEPGYHPRELQYRAALSAFSVGVTEVTNAQFCEFLNDAGNVAYLTVPAIVIDDRGGIRRIGGRFVPSEGRAGHPVTRVTWQGARAYCAWLSRRTGAHYDLPTAAQWEVAARGGTYAPNAGGLHDRTGKVWEWVLDCFDPEFHRYAPMRDPVRFDRNCLAPEIRGGDVARPALRANYWWAPQVDGIGFRVARTGGTP